MILAYRSRSAADTGGFQVVYRVPGRVSIAANEGAKNFRISSATIAPDLLLRAAPAVDATAFLEAGFKHTEDAPLLPGRVAIYRDGAFVGRSQMAMTAKDEDVRLGFGADDSAATTASAHVASGDLAPVAMPRGGPTIEMTGRWVLASTGSGSCAMVFNSTVGAHEGTVAPEGGCPGKFFMSRKWAFEQNSLVIRNHNEEPLAQLSSAQPGRLEGRATNGDPVSLTR